MDSRSVATAEYETEASSFLAENTGDLAVTQGPEVDRRPAYELAKRALDVGVSGTFLVLLLPLLVPIAFAQRLTGDGAIFFGQVRIGWRNRPFLIRKFATMRAGSEKLGSGVVTARNDSRVLPLGAFLRKTKLNEVPQLLNVLRGDMSLVGPRPVPEVCFDEYPEDVQATIYQVKPGLTGVGSIVFRDELDLLEEAKQRGLSPWEVYKNEIYPYKGQLEQWYLQNRSFHLDLFLIFLTAWVLVRPRSRLLFRICPSLPSHARID